jgi:hypothetical protein
VYGGFIMQEVEDYRIEAMGQFHNAVVALIDDTILSVPETILVLRIIANDVQDIFEKSVKGI